MRLVLPHIRGFLTIPVRRLCHFLSAFLPRLESPGREPPGVEAWLLDLS